MSAFTFIEDRRDNPFGGWSRRVRVGEAEYTVSVRRGKSVRLPFKPRGHNRGWRWDGAVWSRTGCVWEGDVNGSIGCRGLLLAAGLIEEKGARS